MPKKTKPAKSRLQSIVAEPIREIARRIFLKKDICATLKKPNRFYLWPKTIIGYIPECQGFNISGIKEGVTGK